MHSEPGGVDRNLDRMESFVREAAKKSADAILFPELSVSGYTLKDPEKIYDLARSQRVLEKIIRMAHDGKLNVMAGMVEIPQEGRPYITHVVAAPEGLLVS
jgi:predicted amidohydrolase